MGKGKRERENNRKNKREREGGRETHPLELETQ